jgi:hypothetical protein
MIRPVDGTRNAGTTSLGGAAGPPAGGSGPGERLRRLVLERTNRLLELDAVLRSRGEPGVLQRSEADLALLEEQVLGPLPVSAPPAPDALTDDERRSWVRQHMRLIPGGVE